jgi:uncharacterized protein YaaW (UPF0174 family)
MTSDNLAELRELLEQAAPEDRANLQKIIDSGFGDSPEHLCDHMQYLWAGAVGQHLERRPYKQLVTDVADEIKIDWDVLLHGRNWTELSASEIEDSVVATLLPRIVASLPEAERRQLAAELTQQVKDKNVVSELLAGGAIVVGNLAGFQVYILATTAVGALSGCLGIALPFAIYTTLTSSIGVVLGPIGWAAIGISLFLRMNRTNWTRLVPAVVYVSYIRHKLQGEA